MNCVVLEFWCFLIHHRDVVSLVFCMPRVIVGAVREFRDRQIVVVGQWRVIVRCLCSLILMRGVVQTVKFYPPKLLIGHSHVCCPSLQKDQVRRVIFNPL